MEREEQLEPKRNFSVFRDRVEKHKEEIAELEEQEKLVEKEKPVRKIGGKLVSDIAARLTRVFVFGGREERGNESRNGRRHGRKSHVLRTIQRAAVFHPHRRLRLFTQRQ